jgi:hypothetical protein
MHFKSFLSVLALLGLGAGLVTHAAAEDAVKLRPMPPLAKNIAAFSRMTAGAPPAVMEKINTALDRDESRLRAARLECFHNGDGKKAQGDWSREIAITMAGPDYLSLVARDDYYCQGAAHPDGGALALVYDLRTGRPVDLVTLLPGLKLAGALATASDGSKMGTIASKELTALYKKAPKPDLDADCKAVLDDQDLTFIAWPDAKAKGLVIEPVGLIHAIAACGVAVTLDGETLKTTGVAPEFLRALAARP